LIRRIALTVLLGAAYPLFSHSQALPTASRTADAQVGIGYAIGQPDYVQQTFPGLTAYADLDFRPHLGVEAEFHQIANADDSLMREQSYEIGGRYLRTYGGLVPYVKAMAGIGVLRYPQGLATLRYTIFAGGAGADLKLTARIHLRAEYEFQKWTSFPNGGLTPQIVTVGVAYHFDGGLRRP
jgi:opacity protein-like surface antigen